MNFGQRQEQLETQWFLSEKSLSTLSTWFGHFQNNVSHLESGHYFCPLELMQKHYDAIFSSTDSSFWSLNLGDSTTSCKPQAQTFLFYNKQNFNEDISKWQTSRVTDMSFSKLSKKRYYYIIFIFPNLQFNSKKQFESSVL